MANHSARIKSKESGKFWSVTKHESADGFLYWTAFEYDDPSFRFAGHSIIHKDNLNDLLTSIKCNTEEIYELANNINLSGISLFNLRK